MLLNTNTFEFKCKPTVPSGEFGLLAGLRLLPRVEPHTHILNDYCGNPGTNPNEPK
ncbi:hypothetical protein PGT21_000878 [Puccinia graminis f. sp. tritici]|uniref:Uncharacterized protein n=1 Tax=Puccinia graminis f. sp. tritici TaxID=56615 RepID=A0A5B0PC67_PUCGR|nr:hypothetical protein PGT21_000878 [Puccinia graminis f. sp. tritici]